MALTARLELADDAFVERRNIGDRRQLSLRSFFHGSVTARRRANRRSGDFDAVIDWHEPHLLFMSIMILLLSVTDAILTLTLISRGAQEANPFLALILDRHPGLFASVKMGLTGMGVIVLVAMARARIFRVLRISTVLHSCVLAYVLLICYEAWLLRLTV
jgi:hypothetical protein